MSDDHEIELRLRWRHTWADKEQDFVAEADGYDGTVGRIYQEVRPGGLDTWWLWAMNAHGHDISRNFQPLSGHEGTPRQAAQQVEKAWFLAIKGSSLDVPGPAVRNAYAAAKGR